MGWWSWLAVTMWVYFGLLFRAFGNRFAWLDAYQRAVDCFSRGLDRAPEDARLYFWRGTLFWRELGDSQRAEADLTRAIELAPKMAKAYLNRAFARWYALPPNRRTAAEDFRAYLSHSDDPYWCSVALQHLQQLEE